MSVISANLAFSGRSGSFSLTSRDYEQMWIVQTDNRLDGPQQIAQFPGVPQKGQYYQHGNDFDPASTLIALSADQDDGNPLLWRVTAAYSSAPQGTQQDDAGVDFNNPILSWGSETFQRIVERDIDGNLMASSAGEFFDPPELVDDAYPMLSVSVNWPSFNPLAIQLYTGAVNSDAWYGMKPYTVKCKNVGASQQQQGDQEYWAVSMSFLFNFTAAPNRTIPSDDSGGWTSYILDRGVKELDDDKNQIHIKDIEGNPVTEPRLLNGRGKQLDAFKYDSEYYQPVFLPRRKFRKLPFNQLIQL